MSDFQLIARQFTEIYYGTFDRDRRELLPLYVSHRLENYWPVWDLTPSFSDRQQPHSKLTWENQTIVGAEAIVEKIAVRSPQRPILMQRTDVLSRDCHLRRSSTRSPLWMLK